MSSNLSTEMLQPVLAAFTWDPDWKTNGRTIGNGPLQVKRGFLHIVHYHWTKLSKYAFTAMIPAFNLQTCPTSTTLRRGWRANPIVEGCRSTRRCIKRASTTPPGYILFRCSAWKCEMHRFWSRICQQFYWKKQPSEGDIAILGASKA